MTASPRHDIVRIPEGTVWFSGYVRWMTESGLADIDELSADQIRTVRRYDGRVPCAPEPRVDCSAMIQPVPNMTTARIEDPSSVAPRLVSDSSR